jgi:hypothetical protein
MIWQTNRRWRFHVRPGDDASGAALKTLSFQQGADLLGKIVVKISHAGFKVDLAHLYRANLFDILLAQRAIAVWAPRPANVTEEKRLVLTNIEVSFDKFKFRIAESERRVSTEETEKPLKFLLSIGDDEKQDWEKTVATLQYGQGQQFLERLVKAMSQDGFKAEVTELWRTDPSRLRQGKIHASRADCHEVTRTVSLEVSSKSWHFKVKRLG